MGVPISEPPAVSPRLRRQLGRLLARGVSLRAVRGSAPVGQCQLPPGGTTHRSSPGSRNRSPVEVPRCRPRTARDPARSWLPSMRTIPTPASVDSSAGRRSSRRLSSSACTHPTRHTYAGPAAGELSRPKPRVSRVEWCQQAGPERMFSHGPPAERRSCAP